MSQATTAVTSNVRWQRCLSTLAKKSETARTVAQLRFKDAGAAEEGMPKTPRAQKELDLPLCVSLEEPRSLIEAGKQWKPPFKLEQYKCAGID